MSIDLQTQESFFDELEKIGIAMRNTGSALGAFKDVGETLGKWTRKGWKSLGSGEAGSGWLGSKFDRKGNPTKIRSKLPIGEKSLFTGFTALGVPAALSEKDPTGRGMSRAERGTSLAAGSLGALAGAGAMLSTRRFTGRPGWSHGVGGLLGGLAAERAATAPFRAVREHKQNAQKERVLQAVGYYGQPRQNR